MSIIPARKGRSTAAATGGGGLEEAWLVVEAPAKTKSHARAAAWAWGVTVSVGPRGRFYSLVLLVLVLLLVLLAASVTTQNGDDDSRGAAPRAATMTTTVSSHSGGQTVTDDERGAQAHHQAAGDCDMASGRWVYDGAAYPLYRENACKFMSDQTACEKYGRTDLKYQRWRWQPHGCDLPRFDAARLLRRLRDKRLVFVGDSLNRSQWVSMVCLIDTATSSLHKSMTDIGSLKSFKIHEYNVSVDFYWSPLLVESNSDHPVHHRMADRVVRAGSIAKHAQLWSDADVLVFNSYLWWRQPAIKLVWGSFEAAADAAEVAHTAAYEETGSLRAFELAIRTWSEWLELHVDRARTQLFFTSISPTHQHSGEWATPAGDDEDGGAGSNHQCYNETEPILAEGHRGRDTDPAFARAVEAEVARLAERGVAVRVLNVTQLSELRKDAHLSVHRRQWSPPTAAELEARARDPSTAADCIHWCLPGVPDVWNQMLYAHIVPS